MHCAGIAVVGFHQWSPLHFTRYQMQWCSAADTLTFTDVLTGFIQCAMHTPCIRMHQQAYKQSQVLLWIRTGRRVCLGSNLNVAHQSNRCQCWMCNKHLGVKATNTCCSTWVSVLNAMNNWMTWERILTRVKNANIWAYYIYSVWYMEWYIQSYNISTDVCINIYEVICTKLWYTYRCLHKHIEYHAQQMFA